MIASIGLGKKSATYPIANMGARSNNATTIAVSQPPCRVRLALTLQGCLEFALLVVHVVTDGAAGESAPARALPTSRTRG